MFSLMFLQNNGKAGYNVGDSQSSKPARGDDISETIQKPLVRQDKPIRFSYLIHLSSSF